MQDLTSSLPILPLDVQSGENTGWSWDTVSNFFFLNINCVKVLSRLLCSYFVIPSILICFSGEFAANIANTQNFTHLAIFSANSLKKYAGEYAALEMPKCKIALDYKNLQ